MSERADRSPPDADADPKPPIKINDASSGAPPRGPFERAERWFLLDANRWIVTALLLLGTFVAIVLVGTFGPVPVESFLTEGINPGAALVELLKTIVSVVVIVLSINQLVLSPGLGPAGNQRTRYEDAMDLRKRVEDHTGARVSPSSPARFFRVLAGEMLDRTDQLERTVEGADGALQREVETYATGVRTEGEYLHRTLGEDRFGAFEVIPTLMRFGISEKVRNLREIRERYDDRLAERHRAAIDELDDLLELFTIAREYIKTVYIRSEYIDLSQGLLYIGLPSLVVTYCAAQIYAPDAFRGTAFGVSTELLFVAGAVTVALAPFVLLIAYVFRLAALSRSTLFVGPFAAGVDKRRTER